MLQINGPSWDVPLGRKDGKISLASEANALIPSPFSNISTLKQEFAAVGLTTKDLVVLSGNNLHFTVTFHKQGRKFKSQPLQNLR